MVKLILQFKHLVNAAKIAGVETELDYVIFQNHGYKGLYGGLDAQAIHNILDHMVY